MPPFKPPGLKIVVEPERPCDGAGSLPRQQQQDARGVRVRSLLLPLAAGCCRLPLLQAAPP